MSETIATVDTATDWQREEKTTDLRFVERGGKFILQQRILTTTHSSRSSRWIDIPIAYGVE